jgi:predicted alpha/beta-fold hydrolase
MVHSIARFALNALDREVCARSHVTAPISHSAGKLAVVTRATQKTREYVASARLWFLGSSVGALKCIGVRSIANLVRSSALLGTMTPCLLNSTPLNHLLNQGLIAH